MFPFEDPNLSPLLTLEGKNSLCWKGSKTNPIFLGDVGADPPKLATHLGMRFFKNPGRLRCFFFLAKMMGRTTNSAMFSGDVLGFFKRNLRFFTVFWGEFFFVKNNRIL